MPKQFQQMKWDDKRIKKWARSIGKFTLTVIDRIFTHVRVKEQGYNAALSILKLSKRYNTKVQRLIHSVKFRVSNASLNDVYYACRELDKETLLNLSTLGFMDNYTNVIFEGCTGGGKSYLACVLGMQACMKGIRTRYIRVPDLLMQKEEMSLDIHSRSKLLKKFTNYGLPILDEWLFDELNEEDLHFLFELIERRYNNGSTVFCTQYKQAEWYR